MKIIIIKSCGSCPYLSEYDWQLPVKCKLFDLKITNETTIHKDCKLKDKEE